MSSLADWIVENKDKIEAGVEMIGKASEVLAATVGKLHPFLEVMFISGAELLRNPGSSEARYVSTQFDLINKKLAGIREEMSEIALELQKSSMNKQNFDQEAQIISQYEKFQDFVNAEPKFKEKKMEKFINHFENTDGDLNLDALYNSVTGDNISGDQMLETVVAIEQRSRRAVEDFCAKLKKLFVVGIIAVMGHAALKEGVVGEEMVKKWKDRMEDVEKRMKAAVDECTEKFADQAKLDVEHMLQENPATVSHEFTQTLLDALVKKYDWVRWSIRTFHERERIFFFNWLAGKKCHGHGGKNWFEFVTKNKIVVVISYCADPKPINKSQIQEKIEARKLKGNMKSLALSLNNFFPDCLVHTVSHYKEVVESHNFHEDSYYYWKHKKAHLCIHPQ
ncbi:uncharacterized protein LOC117823517 [Xyrichtys novacula]|uniref:Uncharacterized protein LOC117823517 n=1 Tax=Xyrichtys novacula TaxID=13765 RepID=A0AAV1FQA1_XYRNO|nr:uncharacterized protein LOC117823517 [Xyrichtys novacula]